MVKDLDASQSDAWLSARGFWATYLVCITVVHLALLSIPVISTATAWTLTHLVHALVTYVAFHWLRGLSFGNQVATDGDVERLTQWEQIDDDEDFSATRKFLIVVPIVLFLLTLFYTHHESGHFIINLAALAPLIVSKMPQMHGVRLFNINKW